MDYVTRQFINVAKKFRKDLRNALSDLNGALNKQTEAIRKSYQADNNKQSPPPEVTVVNNFPESVEVHHNTKDTRDERNYRRVMFFVTSLTLGAIVIYADLVYLQYRQMIEATNAGVVSANAAHDAAKTAADALIDSRKSFQLQQRPFLTIERVTEEFPKGTIIGQIPSGDGYVEFFFFNSGRTPALRVTTEIDTFLDGKLESKITPSTSHSQATVASGIPVNSDVIMTSSQKDATRVNLGIERWEIRFTIHYSDIFRDTHTTKACVYWDTVKRLYAYCNYGQDIE
jgi:hypothetical protein